MVLGLLWCNISYAEIYKDPDAKILIECVSLYKSYRNKTEEEKLKKAKLDNYKYFYKRTVSEYLNEKHLPLYTRDSYCYRITSKKKYPKLYNELNRYSGNYLVTTSGTETRNLKREFKDDFERIDIEKSERPFDYYLAPKTALKLSKKDKQNQDNLEKIKIAEEKRKIEEERLRLAEQQRQIEDAKKLKEEEEKNYRKLVKDFGPECESSWSNLFTGHKVGTEEFDACLLEKLDEKVQLANLEKDKIRQEEKIFNSLDTEEQKAYTCNKTFGFRKGSDNFKDCIFKLYTTQLEMEKLEIQQLLATQQEKLLDQEKQIAQQASKIKQINQAASETALLIEQKKLEAAQAQTKAAQQQAAAAMQMAQTQKKSYNRQKANALYNMFQNLSTQNNTRSTSTSLGMKTCRVYGTGALKRVECY